MRIRPRFTRGALALTLAALAGGAVAGCVDARVTGVWRDADPPPPARSMLVVSRRADAAQRRLWEDEVVTGLQRAGVRAVASYALFPDGVPGQREMLSALRSQELDAALVLKPLSATRETRWVPGWDSIQPREYYDPWNGRDVIVYRGRHHRGHVEVDRTSREQATVWSGEGGGRMVWAATVETTDPASADESRHDIGAGVAPALRKARVI